MTAHHLAIGLDGADHGVVQDMGPRELPNLHALMRAGAHAALRSVEPPATLPNWTTFLTGKNPGEHGVFDFTTRTGYAVRFTAGSVRECATIASRLDKLGKACACLFFPATFPPEALAHGVFVSGWDAPVAFEADPSFVHPRSLYDDLRARFGPLRFGDVDEFDTARPDFFAELSGRLVQRIERRVELCRYLLRKRPWDLFAVYFGESDTASHHLWALHDPGSPRNPARLACASDREGNPARLNEREASGLRRVYRSLDAAVGRLVACAGGRNVEVTILSDHGFGGSSDKVLYLNRALAEAGLLSFRGAGVLDHLVGHAKEAALTRLPPRLREAAFRMAGAVLPSHLESRARYGMIDMAQTRAFSDELNYFPAVHLNLEGRDPRGIVPAHRRQPVIEQVQDALLSLRDPWTGAAVVARVMPRESLYWGPFVERAPDLLLALHEDNGYSYNLMPSASAPPGTGPFRRLSEDEYLGRKGRSLQGSHRPRGLWIAAGPQVRAVGEVDAHIMDATATLLARMGNQMAEEGGGRVIQEALERRSPAKALPTVRPARDPRPVTARASEQGRVAERLRRLGYIE